MIILLAIMTWFQPAQNVADSVVFKFGEFVNMVTTNHPVSRQASILFELAKADSLSQRGVLDPKLEYEFSNKNFQDSEYYSYSLPSLTIPTSTGIDFKLGMEQTDGIYLNPESLTPGSGLFAAGVVVPIGRGIVNNERTITLKKAQNMVRMSDADRDLTIISLLREASLCYGQWYFAYRALLFSNESYLLASNRYGFVKESFFAGDEAAIDTLEALNEIVKRSLILKQDSLNVAKNLAYLNNYLWNASGDPIMIAEDILPEVHIEDLLSLEPDWLKIASNIEQHPSVLVQKLKTALATLDRRFYSTQRMPDVEFNYFPLFDAGESDLESGNIVTNQKASLSVQIPLLFRKERGAFEKAKQKEYYETLELDIKTRYLSVALDATSRQWNLLKRQISEQERLVSLDKALLLAEQIKFEAGESSLFVVNSRERRLLQNQIYLVELQHKLFDLWIELAYLNSSLPE